MVRFFSLIAATAAIVISTSSTAKADSSAQCGPAITETQLTALLNQYGKAYATNAQPWKYSEQISDAIFCLGKSSEYAADLKLIEARAVGSNPKPYLLLSQTLQDDWETRYLLKVVNGRLRRENLAAEGSNSLLLISVTLGFFKVPDQIGNYFGLFRQLIPVMIPSAATLTAKAVNATGLLDNAYPVAPAHVMTELKLPEQEETYKSFDVLRAVSAATLSVGGTVAATELINYLSVGIVTIGGFTCNPLTIAASIALSYAGKYVGTKAIDEYEFISLKNDLVRINETIRADVANGDAERTHDDGDDFYKSVVQLASSLDLKEITAYNNYQKSVAEANASRHIPLIDETSATHARQVYENKMAKIQASRGPKYVDELELYMTLNLVDESPAQLLDLPPRLSIESDALLEQYDDYVQIHGENHYKAFIRGLKQEQMQRLGTAYQNGDIPKDSQYVILEALSFLQMQNTSILNGTIKELQHLLQTGLILQMD